MWGHSLNVLLLVGICASLIGATLAFVTLDLNDLRFNPNADENKGPLFIPPRPPPPALCVASPERFFLEMEPALPLLHSLIRQ